MTQRFNNTVGHVLSTDLGTLALGLRADPTTARLIGQSTGPKDGRTQTTFEKVLIRKQFGDHVVAHGGRSFER